MYRAALAHAVYTADSLFLQSFIDFQNINTIGLTSHDQQVHIRGELSFSTAFESLPRADVIDDHMPRARRKLRDPLGDVSMEDITFTNLPLLSRLTLLVGIQLV